MDARTELSNLLSQMKTLLRWHQEIGIDPPPVSAGFRVGSGNESVGPGLGRIPVDTGKAEAGGQERLAALGRLRERIGDCQRCKLARGRTHLVFGEGSPEARLVFVGEGPGRDEDLAGRPFVGESGKLLTRIIENGMRLTRGDVYICNVIKCHPPGNRDPEVDEIHACLPFLREQLRIIGPEVICTLGRVAAQALLGKGFRITEERGKWRAYDGIALMPTFHPAYLLRNESAKWAVWKDIKEIMKRLGLEVKPHG